MKKIILSVFVLFFLLVQTDLNAKNKEEKKSLKELKQQLKALRKGASASPRSSTASFKERPPMSKKEIKAFKKQQKTALKTAIKSARLTDNDQGILMIILAVILPPAAVGLTFGMEQEFWIDLLLTLLFWLPGVIYALIKILG